MPKNMLYNIVFNNYKLVNTLKNIFSHSCVSKIKAYQTKFQRHCKKCQV